MMKTDAKGGDENLFTRAMAANVIGVAALMLCEASDGDVRIMLECAIKAQKVAPGGECLLTMLRGELRRRGLEA